MMLAAKDRFVLQRLAISFPGQTHSIRALMPFVLVALLISIPCVWQEHIQSVDLSSHLYNAWLVKEVNAGHVSGLHVATQYTNVMFDVALSFLLKHTGNVVITERIAVAAAVQVFFWGCFVFVSAAGNRRAWSVVPLLSMLAYGAVFRIGFFNFYISMGFCLMAIALAWNRRPWWRVLVLLVIAFTAHFLPCIWAVGIIGYLIMARRLAERRRVVCLSVCIAAIIALSGVLALLVPSAPSPGPRVDSLLGADQMMMWGAKYRIVAASSFCAGVLLLIRRFDFESPFKDIALQLWILCSLACLVFPDAVWLPIYTSGLSYISIRLSLICGILFCAVIAARPMPRFAQVAYALIAITFFGLSYGDEGSLNRVEREVRNALSTLPRGALVLSTLRDPSLYVQGLEHLVDRPCIGRCFDFGNYEPSTSQFRLRADAGNSYVLAQNSDIGAIEHGRFVFSRRDLLVYRLFPCGHDHFCVAQITPGEHVASQELNSLSRRD